MIPRAFAKPSLDRLEVPFSLRIGGSEEAIHVAGLAAGSNLAIIQSSHDRAGRRPYNVAHEVSVSVHQMILGYHITPVLFKLADHHVVC